jgi:predicted nuclease with TOPRIM domain
MADGPENLLLHILRNVDAKVDRIAADLKKIKVRSGILGQQYANMSNRIDRIEDRLERIENRLGLIDA